MECSSYNPWTKGIAVSFPVILSHPEEESDGIADGSDALVRNSHNCNSYEAKKKQNISLTYTFSFNCVNFSFIKIFPLPRNLG